MRKGLVALVVVFTITLLSFPFLMDLPEAMASPKVVVDQWNIPFQTILTGPATFVGIDVKWAVERTAKEINANGGIAGKPIVLKTCDTAANPTHAVACMNKAVGFGIVVLGPIFSSSVRSSMPIAEREGVCCIAPASNAHQVRMSGPKFGISFLASPDKLYGPGIAMWLKENPDIKSIVQFVLTTNPAWTEAANVQRNACKAKGVKVLEDIEVVAGAVEMGPVAVRALAKKPDGFAFVCGPDEAGRILLELYERGVKDMGKFLMFAPGNTPVYHDVAGEKLNGTYIYDTYNPAYPGKQWQAFLKDFHSSHGGKNPSFACYVFRDALYAIKAAIEQTGVTGDPKKLKDERLKIKDFVWNLKGFSSIMGEFGIVNGEVKGKIFLFKIKNGEQVLVDRFVEE